MSTRHLITRVKEHLNLRANTKTAINDHILDCNKCCNFKYDLSSFKVLKTCRNVYETKIHEALLIKKHSTPLNKQLYANVSSYLLAIY